MQLGKHFYEIKALKTEQSRNGIAIEASLYQDGKKIGLIIDRANGGPIEPLREGIPSKVRDEIMSYMDEDEFVNALLQEKHDKESERKHVRKLAKAKRFCYRTKEQLGKSAFGYVGFGKTDVINKKNHPAIIKVLVKKGIIVEQNLTALYC